jgi:bidirectional [NiFe] hydrogenase diaphorase subunit
MRGSIYILSEKCTMQQVTLTIDGKKVTAPRGRKLLWVALDEGFYIPHLCSLEEMPLSFGGCRLCFVEVEGREDPVAACSQPAEDGMVVRTGTPRVRALARRSFELILSNHPLPCKGCHANGRCGLQDIARRMRFKLAHPGLAKAARKHPVDDSHERIIFDPNTCILCGLCVYMCNEVEKARAINFEYRGMDMRVGTCENIPLAQSSCTSCMRCVQVCPVGAFRSREDDRPLKRRRR